MRKKTKVVVTLYKHKNLGDVEMADSEVKLISNLTLYAAGIPLKNAATTTTFA